MAKDETQPLWPAGSRRAGVRQGHEGRSSREPDALLLHTLPLVPGARREGGSIPHRGFSPKCPVAPADCRCVPSTQVPSVALPAGSLVCAEPRLPAAKLWCRDHIYTSREGQV